MRPVARFIIVAIATGLIINAPASAGPRILQVPVANRAELLALNSLGVEIVASGHGMVTLAVPANGPIAAQVNRVLSRATGVKVIKEDADDYFRPYRNKIDKGAYHTLEEISADLKQLADKYPTMAQVGSIGKTSEQRDVQILRITGANAGKWGKPVFLFMGCHHAREWISVEVPLAIAHYLLENYATDAGVKALVDSREIWILPAVNPDGLKYSQTQSRYWRKTRRKNDDGTFGVDPNRNYGYKWGTAGDSSSPSSDVYHGTGAFSEPETCNVRDFAIAHNLTASVSYHSYGRTILYPWSYGDDQSPDKDLFAKVAAGMAEKNQYHPQQSVELYPSSGDTDDFLYGSTGSLSYTIELADEFIPAESEIPAICSANVDAARYLLENGAEPFPMVVHTPTSTPASGPVQIQASFDAAHHPYFTPATVVLCVRGSGGDQEIPMTADPAHPGVYTATLPRTGDGKDLNYYFGLTAADGKTARTPRLTDFHTAK